MVGTRRLNFKLFRSEKGYCVRFWEDGGSSIEAPFQADLREGGRLSGVIAKIESDVCTRDDLRDLGAEIWTGLNTEPVGRAVAEARRRPDSFFHICFELPPEQQSTISNTPFSSQPNQTIALFVLLTSNADRYPPSKNLARSSACSRLFPKGQVWVSSKSSIT
jgi:hypothetical protein